MRTGPDYIQLYPTLRCNKSCGFCFNKSMQPMPDMTPDDFTNMLGKLRRAGVRTLDIMGGEPSLHPDIVSMAGEARSEGLSVNISSNGSHRDVLADLMRLGERVTVGISINDQETLAHLSAFIAAEKPVVKSVYSRQMDHRMARQILLLKPKQYYLLYRDAMASDEMTEAMPFAEYHAAVERNFSGSNTGMVYCGGFLADTREHPELERVRCPAGTTKLSVAPDGSVYPCNLFIGNREFLLGNIRDDSFGAIWTHPALAYFRTPGRSVCSHTACRFHAVCHGGCPAHSYALHGNLALPDPRCCHG